MSSGSTPVNATTQLAQSLAGSDPAVIINAGDQRLADYLAMPTHQLLNHLGLPRRADLVDAVPTAAGALANPGGAMNSVSPTQLISPVISALSTLGTGMNPTSATSALSGIASALNGTSSPVQQALSAVQQGWQGASSAAASTKTATALANGAEVATQAAGLRNILSAATADVAQARTQLIAIIDEFEATVAANQPLIFPWQWVAVVQAAAQAVTHAAQVMTETQSSLAAHASAASATGTPVSVTSASQVATSGTSTAGSLGSSLSGSTSSAASPLSALSMLSPLMYGATAGISPALSAATAAGKAAGPAAATGATAGTLADATAADPAKATGAEATPAGKSGVGATSVPQTAGGGGLVSRVTAPATSAVPEAETTAVTAAPTRSAASGMAMTGAGMTGAPLAGAAHANSAGSSHTAASYLHTSDQGGKVVRDRSTVAPPVIGEADPSDTPDIELRI